MKGFFKIVICFVLVLAVGIGILEVSKPKVDNGLTGELSPLYNHAKTELDILNDEAFGQGWVSGEYFRDKYRDGEVQINVSDLTAFEKNNLREYWRTKALAYLYHCDSLYYYSNPALSSVAGSPVLIRIKFYVDSVANTQSLRNTSLRRDFDARHQLHDRVHTFVSGSWAPGARSTYRLVTEGNTAYISFQLQNRTFAGLHNSKSVIRRQLLSELSSQGLLRQVNWINDNLQDESFLNRKAQDAFRDYQDAERQKLIRFLNNDCNGSRLSNLTPEQRSAFRRSVQNLRSNLNSGNYSWSNSQVNAAISALERRIAD